jgi:hypothetical protein
LNKEDERMIVQSPEGFHTVLETLSEHRDWTVDVETNGLDAFGSNNLCGVGVMPVGEPEHAFYFPFRHQQGVNLSRTNLLELMEVMSSR